MTRPRPFAQVDVFSAMPCQGNPVAVVLDGEGLSDAAMQRFAHWTNLSETTFVLPPTDAQADYRVRIFTPGAELPFAGHPTLGTCLAWLAAGGRPQRDDRVVQQCAKGLIPIQRQRTAAGDACRLMAPLERLAFAAPPSQRQPVPAALLAQIVDALGLHAAQVLRAQWLDNGPVWLSLQLDSASTVRSLRPDHVRLAALGHKVGVVGIHANAAHAARTPASHDPQDTGAAAPPLHAPVLIARSSREARAFAAPAQRAASHGAPVAPPLIEVRAFAAPIGVAEDPVTGSLNASLAQWLIGEGVLPSRYVAAQGSALGRAGRVHIHRDEAGQVWVGGDSVQVIQGQMRL